MLSSLESSDGLDGIGSIPSLLHSVIPIAQANFYSLSEAVSYRVLQTVGMNKNGGPNFLRSWREKKELSQEALAELVGTTASMISHLENGERGLSAKWLRRLAPALGTQPGWLLDLDPNEIDRDVIDLWTHATSRERGQIVQIAKTIVTGTDD